MFRSYCEAVAVSKAIPAELIALAKRQGGLLSRKQVAAWGLNSRHIQTLIRQGHAELLFRAIRLVHAAPAWLRSKPEPYQKAFREAQAIALSFGPGTVITGAVAVELLREDRRVTDGGWRERFAAGTACAYLSGDRSPQTSGVSAIRAPLFGASLTRGGVQLADRTAAILDEITLLYGNGGAPGESRATPLLDFVLQRRWVDADAIARHLALMEAPRDNAPRSRRLAPVRWANSFARAGMISEAERVCGELLESSGLSRGGPTGWHANLDVECAAPDGLRAQYRLDFAWPHRRVAIEVDGREWHTAPGAFERDRAKLRSLATAGWKVLPVTWRDLKVNASSFLQELTSALKG